MSFKNLTKKGSALVLILLFCFGAVERQSIENIENTISLSKNLSNIALSLIDTDLYIDKEINEQDYKAKSDGARGYVHIVDSAHCVNRRLNLTLLCNPNLALLSTVLILS